ncbi:glutathione peroxidase [Shewanella sedimentimangrovi]|uniref:Glutathione peroxidase n=1 Tax=Shewanella sedimentimangrovi TaxID=2814293 RepID=A0ABX7R385_9GAMM|nr:glutathione peroxidase [Shewanella sedimentimangrovi]QSX38184.1 glutathione peroxidase [Shewanella sedimentimangrovi]
MKTSCFLPALALLSLGQLAVAEQALADCPDFLNQELRKLHSEQTVDLCQLTAGKPVLIVNTASHCGFTPQFKGLEALHQKYKDQGLVVLGFPSDDFFQEEDREQDTAKICFINYGVTFNMFATSAVWGSDVNPVFKYLGEKAGSPKWNFFKYLVSGDGSVVTRFNSRVTPEDPALVSAIEAALVKHNKS